MPFIETIVVGAIALVALGWAFQRSLIYLPMDQTVPAAADVLPGASDVSLDTADGLRLGGWFLPARAGASRGTVLVFNGNAGNRSYRAPLAEALSGAGYSVLLFDYRGYGGNPGRPSEEGLAADARAARTYLEGRRDVNPASIAYFGESLGAAVALGAAVEIPPAALVLRSPFTSLVDVGTVHYPFLPLGLLLRDRYPSLSRISQIRFPLLVVAGDRDSIVPFSQSKALFDAAPEGAKRFVTVPGADHNDPRLTYGEPMMGEVVRFFWRHL
jgi:fermentation-respiration switch protein FrsA (DUF1100 family)